MSYRIYANAYIDDEVCGHFQLFDNNELPEDFACWLIEQGFECKNGNIGTFEGFEVSPVALAQCMERYAETEYNKLIEQGKNPFALPREGMPFGCRLFSLVYENRVLDYIQFMRWLQDMELAYQGLRDIEAFNKRDGRERRLEISAS